MTGAIGATVTDAAPLLQRLDNTGERYDWPDPELTDGVANITVTSYGDEPGVASIRVCGIDPAAVHAAYWRTAQALRAIQPPPGLPLPWWPKGEEPF